MPSSLITILDSSNTPRGPFSLDDVQRRLAKGEFLPTQLAHTEGLTAWAPLTTVIAHVQGQSAPPVPAPVAPPLYQSGVQPPASLVYAGFWLRAAACILDTILILFVLYTMIAILTFLADPSHFFHNMSGDKNQALENGPFWVELVLLPSIFFGPILYLTLMESSSKQATLGKMAAGIKATDLQGQRLSFGHALGRNAAKVITNMTCCVFYIGYILAGITEQKQALHDMIASTLVLRK